MGLIFLKNYLIFHDEFLVYRNTINTYGWTKAGMPGRLFLKPLNFRMSFVVSHSANEVEGVMRTKTTFTQAKIIKFLKHLVSMIKRKHPNMKNKIVLTLIIAKFTK